MKLWKKLEVVENPPIYLESTDVIYYARDYVAGGGFKASEANNLISNFKKSPRQRNTAAWAYKERAIEQFAWELAQGLSHGLSVAAVPASRMPSDPDYDSRLHDTLAALKRNRPDLSIEHPFVCRTTLVAAHRGGPRTIEELHGNLEWRGIGASCRSLVLIDDVITTGAHFKACQRMLAQHAPGVSLAGVFWARTVWPAPPGLFDLSTLPS